jgi:hypothetical protein
MRHSRNFCKETNVKQMRGKECYKRKKNVLKGKICSSAHSGTGMVKQQVSALM